jgi:hypothetical protein
MEALATVSSGIVTNYTPAPTVPVTSDEFPGWILNVPFKEDE